MEREISCTGPVLVPLDGSETAEHALPAAEMVARKLNCEVLLIQVLPLTTWAFAVSDAFTSQETYDSILRDEEVRSYAYLTPQVKSIRNSGLRASIYITRGDVAPALLAAMTDFRASLVVMTTHGRSGLGRMALGSVADYVVRHGDVPVLLLRSAAKATSLDQLERAIVPLDGSATAEHALRLARTWMRPMLSAVELVRVVPCSAPEERAGAEGYLHDVSHKLTYQSAPHTACALSHRVLEGEAAHEILAAARQAEAMIIMATRGHTGLQRLRLGSVAEHVVHDARGPVLLVRA